MGKGAWLCNRPDYITHSELLPQYQFSYCLSSSPPSAVPKALPPCLLTELWTYSDALLFFPVVTFFIRLWILSPGCISVWCPFAHEVTGLPKKFYLWPSNLREGKVILRNSTIISNLIFLITSVLPMDGQTLETVSIAPVLPFPLVYSTILLIFHTLVSMSNLLASAITGVMS